MPDFIPRRDADLLRWSSNFDQKINFSPASFGISHSDAAEYAVLHASFAQLYAAAVGASTRTPSGIIAKDDARAALVKRARQLANRVRGHMEVTDAQRLELGLRVKRRATGMRRRIQRPSHAPVLQIISVQGSTVRIRLGNSEMPTHRTLPRDVKGAMICSYIGEQPPPTLAGWSLRPSITRTTCEVTFPPGLPPGTRVWVTAYWFNHAGAPRPGLGNGPAAMPVGTWLVPNVLTMRRAMKLAA
jgi:hypothetical protein